jgi:lipopolysaccharide/colanic/teichoic acid biosynthesis glycosyltransferase
MTPLKRMFDISVALVLSVPVLPMILLIAAILRWRQGGAVFYLSERMKTPHEPFYLWKFRTMIPVEADRGVTGGDKTWRVTRIGRLLRRSRLDELPQLWNVLRGDISFVGPRPPLREFVDRFPDLYTQVLASRPGITGLATLRYHAHEDRLLARCTSAAESDRIYCDLCLPRKARLDMIYQRHRSIGWDVLLMLQTAWRAAHPQKFRETPRGGAESEDTLIPPSPTNGDRLYAAHDPA